MIVLGYDERGELLLMASGFEFRAQLMSRGPTIYQGGVTGAQAALLLSPTEARELAHGLQRLADTIEDQGYIERWGAAKSAEKRRTTS